MENENIQNIRKYAIETANMLEKYMAGQLITTPRRLSKELIRLQARILDEASVLDTELKERKKTRGPKHKEQPELHPFEN